MVLFYLADFGFHKLNACPLASWSDYFYYKKSLCTELRPCFNFTVQNEYICIDTTFRFFDRNALNFISIRANVQTLQHVSHPEALLILIPIWIQHGYSQAHSHLTCTTPASCLLVNYLNYSFTCTLHLFCVQLWVLFFDWFPGFNLSCFGCFFVLFVLFLFCLLFFNLLVWNFKKAHTHTSIYLWSVTTCYFTHMKVAFLFCPC